MINEAPKITVEDKLDIQFYICFLLDQLGKLTENQLSDIITECETVNYYDYLEALSIVVEKKLAEKSEEKSELVYSLMPHGKMMSEEFYQHIPLSVREKSVEYGKKVLELSEVERALQCRIERTQEAHCFVTVRFINEMGGPDLVNLRLYAPNLEEAKKMKERFYERPSEIITKIMQLFIKDNY